jgi:hypothetical protein
MAEYGIDPQPDEELDGPDPNDFERNKRVLDTMIRFQGGPHGNCGMLPEWKELTGAFESRQAWENRVGKTSRLLVTVVRKKTCELAR